jgi:hypothetical protein
MPFGQITVHSTKTRYFPNVHNHYYLTDLTTSIAAINLRVGLDITEHRKLKDTLVTPSDTMLIPSFVKTTQLVQTLKRGNTGSTVIS